MPSPSTAQEAAALEARIRVDLAACYRLIALRGWDDLIYTHISAHVPGPEPAFLINPIGLMFDEIRASDLVKVDLEGRILEPSPRNINAAGFVIHSAVHAARPDAGCVIHLHTPAGVAVSALEAGLLPLNQSAIGVATDMAYHEFEGPALHLEERERLVADLGTCSAMILRNHGTLALGPTVAEAYHRMYFLERACEIQILTLGMGQPLHHPAAEAVEVTAEVTRSISGRMIHNHAWPALLRRLDRVSPGYAD